MQGSTTDWLMVIITAIYVLATIKICLANIETTKVAKESLEEAKKEFLENRRALNDADIRRQASQIACWTALENIDVSKYSDGSHVPVPIHIVNSSKEPIYDAVLSYDDVQYESEKDLMLGDDCNTYIQCIPPGDYYTVVQFGGYGMNRHFGPSISFRDVSGNNWFRDVNGKLVQIYQSSIEQRHLSLPVSPSELYTYHHL